MNKEFIPYDEALALEELGFDELCIYYVDEKDNGYIYNFESHPDEFIKHCCNLDINVIKTPLYQQAFRWFREKHGLFGTIDKKDGIRFYKIEDENEKIMAVSTSFKTYEEAELACLKKLIEIVKTKK